MIGLDIGGTKCAVSVGEVCGERLVIQDKRVIPTDTSSAPYEMLARMCDAARELTDDMSRIGISCGGPLDISGGRILSPPNLPGWDDVRVVDFVKQRLGGRVTLRNDADACALAEWRYGAGRGCDSMVFLTFGTGLGAGLILGGRLWQGAHGMAGEVGHIRLATKGPEGYRKKGSFEGFCSGAGIARQARLEAARRLSEGNPLWYCRSEQELSALDTRLLAEQARGGDPTACRIFERVGRRLGGGLAILADMLDPEVIVIGSVFVRCEDLLRPAMERVFAREALAPERCRILPAALGESIGDMAALCVALE